MGDFYSASSQPPLLLKDLPCSGISAWLTFYLALVTPSLSPGPQSQGLEGGPVSLVALISTVAFHVSVLDECFHLSYLTWVAANP